MNLTNSMRHIVGSGACIKRPPPCTVVRFYFIHALYGVYILLTIYCAYSDFSRDICIVRLLSFKQLIPFGFGTNIVEHVKVISPSKSTIPSPCTSKHVEQSNERLKFLLSFYCLKLQAKC